MNIDANKLKNISLESSNLFMENILADKNITDKFEGGGVVLKEKLEEAKSKADDSMQKNISNLSQPTQQVNDKIWLIVIISFSFVMVVAAIVLSYSVIKNLGPNVDRGIILAIFTSMVGFLSGLFSPSPVNRNNN